MEDAAFDKNALVAGLIMIGAGLVLLTSLGAPERRLRLAAIIGAVTGALAYGAAAGAAVVGAGAMAQFLGKAALAAVAGVVPAALLSLLAAGVLKLLKSIRAQALWYNGEFDRILAPAKWELKDAPAPQAPLAGIDIARRWFVTIAAGVGGAVGAVVGTEAFWLALKQSLTPAGILGAGIVTGASVALIGPFQDYVLDRRERALGEPEAPDKHFADLFTGRASARSWMRLGLVGLLLLSVELAFNSLDNSIKSGEAFVAAVALTGAATPAIVSFYWSAALQRGLKPLAGRATAASTAAGAMLFSFLCFAVMFADAVDTQDVVERLAPALFVSPLLAIILSFGTCGVYAWFGGVALDRYRGRGPMRFLVLALLAGALVQLVFSFGATRLFGIAGFDPWAAMNIGAVALFWAVGLFASGFPKLVQAPPAAGLSEAQAR